MKQTGTLSRQLVVRFLILSLIAVLGLGFAIWVSLWGTLQSVQAQTNDAGQVAAHTFDQFLGGVEHDLLATGDSLVASEDTAKIFQRALERQFAIFELILVDPQGEVLAQRRRVGSADLATLPEQPWLNAVRNGETYVGPVDFEEYGVPFVDMAIAVTDDSGQFAATLVARVDLTTLWNMVIGLQVGDTGYVYITDETGQLLAYRDLQLVRAGADLPQLVGRTPQAIVESDSTIFAGIGGNQVIAVGVPLEVVPWYVVVEQSIGEALASFALLAAGLLMAFLLVILLVYTTGRFINRRIVSPLSLLRQGVAAFSQGNLEQRIDVQANDELGSLADAFNSMATELRGSFETLEERVQSRTRALETGAFISRQLTTILDVDELLQQVVSNIQNAFGYYHVHIYLIEEGSGELVMREGSGDVGQELKAKGHTLQPGQGIVGQAASSGEAALVPNVDDVPGFHRNPLLPKTQAELAVPIRKGEAILGVLDAQSEERGGFDQEDLTLMQAVSDQVAVALDNARLFEEAQAAVAEAEGLARQLTREVWQDVEQKVDTTGYVFTRSGVTPDDTEWLPVMGRAVQQKQLIHLGSNGRGTGESASSLAIPLTLRNEVVGVIGLERPADRAWTEDELTTIQNIAEQAALALDAARLTRETERAAWRDRVVSEATAHVWASSEIEEVMRAAVAELGDKLKASEVVIRLGAESKQETE